MKNILDGMSDRKIILWATITCVAIMMWGTRFQPIGEANPSSGGRGAVGFLNRWTGQAFRVATPDPELYVFPVHERTE
jgi:hypothetical protein